MGWVPLVSGCIGSTLGGVVSDFLTRRHAQRARLWVLIACNIVAAPLTAAALLLPAPACFGMLFCAYIFGEMWLGVALALVVDTVQVVGKRLIFTKCPCFFISPITAVVYSLLSA